MATVSARELAGLLGPAAERGPAYRDLAERIRLLVVDGRLGDGARLPAERDLAATLGLSRTTVAAAYAALRGVGRLRSRQGSGHFVVGDPGTAAGPGRSRVGPGEVAPLALTVAASPMPPTLAALAEAAAGDLGRSAGHSGYLPDGLPVLRERLADWFTARGLPTGPDQVIVTGGALVALNLVWRALLGTGDRVLLESPTYPNAIEAVRRCGGRPQAYPLPPEGWEPDGFEAAVRQSGARLAYLVPEFHNPTGRSVPEPVRAALAGSLRRHRVVPVVDETLVELSLDEDPPTPPFGTYARDAVTVGSASKAFWGGLRIGWIRAPLDLVPALVQARSGLDLGASVLEQDLTARLLADPGPTLDWQRTRLRAGREALLARLAADLPDWRVGRPAGGMVAWVRLPTETSGRLAAAAERHGLRLTPGPRFFVGGGGHRHLRLPYTAEPADLAEAVRRLRLARDEVESAPEAAPRWALDLGA